ncbi:TPA: hypothetical protein ACGO2T_000679 [Streptococcus suis]
MKKTKMIAGLLVSSALLGVTMTANVSHIKADTEASTDASLVTIDSNQMLEEQPLTVEEQATKEAENGEILGDEVPNQSSNLEEVENVISEPKAEAIPETKAEDSTLSEFTPRAVRSAEHNLDMESLPVTPELPNEKQPAYIQDTNYPGKPFQLQQSVLIKTTSVTDKKIEWEVTFKAGEWAFYESIGGYYFILPDGLKLTKLVDQSNADILNHYKSEGAGGDEYRAFENGKGEFDAQWGWSAGLMDNAIFNKWKDENRFSKIFFRDHRRDVQTITYKIETEIEKQSEKPFSLIAVIKNFNKYTHYIYGDQIASAAGLEVVAPRTEKVPKEKKAKEGKERKKDRSKKNRHSHKEHKKQHRTRELTGRKK